MARMWVPIETGQADKKPDSLNKDLVGFLISVGFLVFLYVAGI